MDLSVYIEELLFDHDRVTIPGFGSFLATYTSAQKNQADNKLLPPQRKISFHPDMKTSEGVLIAYLTKTLGLSKEEAEKEISSYIEEIETQLASAGYYTVANLGKINKSLTGNVSFEPDYDHSFLYDSYGLEPLEVKEKKAEEPIYTPPKAYSPKDMSHEDGYERRRINRNRIMLFTPIAAALVFLFIYLSWQYFDDTSVSLYEEDNAESVIMGSGQEPAGKKENSTTLTEQQGDMQDTAGDQSSGDKEITQKIEEQTDKKKALYYEPPEHIYYLIAGSFKSLSNARVLMNELSNKGYPSEIIPRNGKGYRVAIESYDSKEKALQALYRLRDKYKKEIWVLEGEK